MGNTIKKLVRTSCANYVVGQCALLDKECPLISGGEYRGNKIPASECSCSYFEKAVLPANKTSEALYYGKEAVIDKLCIGCGKGFNTVSNRGVYCGDICRKSARKQSHVRYNQKRVNNDS